MHGDNAPDPGSQLPLHQLTDQEVPSAVDLLVRAFERDPFVDWIARSDDRRDEGMRRFFNVCLRQLTMPFGEVWATQDLEALAMWAPPGRFKVGLPAQMRFLNQLVRGAGLMNVRSRLNGIHEIERHHPQAPHYYLFLAAVDPDRQGEGIGSQMLRQTLDRCDAEATPAYLEATRQDLVTFYGHLRFCERTPIQVTGGPTMYPMWRDPSEVKPRPHTTTPADRGGSPSDSQSATR